MVPVPVYRRPVPPISSIWKPERNVPAEVPDHSHVALVLVPITVLRPPVLTPFVLPQVELRPVDWMNEAPLNGTAPTSEAVKLIS